MKALVYHGPGRKSWDQVPDPTVSEPTDVVVRIDTTTICGTDLHILKGDVPTVEPGRLLGHEAVSSVIAGATSPEQVKTNAAAAAWALTPEEVKEVGDLIA